MHDNNRIYGHPSTEGNRLTANAIMQQLFPRVVLKPSQTSSDYANNGFVSEIEINELRRTSLTHRYRQRPQSQQ